MSAKVSWDWLSEPLAHNFANTIHWRGTTPIDHITTLDGLSSWLEHEPNPLPPVAEIDPSLAASIRSLRDAVRQAMIAVTGGRRVQDDNVNLINTIACRHPMTHVLSPDSQAAPLVPARDGIEPLLGVLAQAAVTTLGKPEHRQRIAFCAAPGCGSLFERERSNQVWCDPHCGARARAERHLQSGR